MTVRVLGVGAAAPELRLHAADVGAAWGRGGRGEVAVCAPDEDTLTLAWQAADRALTAAGIVEPTSVDALFWGTSRPPFAEGPSFAFLASALEPGADDRAARSARARPTPGWKPSCAGADAIARGIGPGRAGDRVRCGAPRSGHRLRSALRRRRRRARPLRRRSPATPRSAPASPAPARSSTATAATARSTTATCTTGDCSAKRSSCPSSARSPRSLAAFDVRAWSLPDPDGRLGAVVARGVKAATTPVARRSTPRSAMPARRPRCSAASPRSTRRASSRSSAPAAAAPRACSINADAAGAGRGRSPPTHSPAAGPRATPSRAARPRATATRRRDDPHGRAARERDVRARRRRDARPARRALRRLRNDQHAAVDPPALHQLRRAASSSRSRSHGPELCTRSSSTRRCRRRSSRRCRSRCSTWTTAPG